MDEYGSAKSWCFGVSFVLALLSLFQKSFLKTEDVFCQIIVNNLQLCVCLGICLCMCVRACVHMRSMSATP